MAASLLAVVSLLLVTVSSSLANRVVLMVSAREGQACPPHHHCHNLSYYLPQTVNYIYYNTDLVFLEGKHQLDRETRVHIKGKGSLRLMGGGEWVTGPDELVMQSTAEIYCNKNGNGFRIEGFSSVLFDKLTFTGCGASFKYMRAAVVLHNIGYLLITRVSIQYSHGRGLATIDCNQVNVEYSSFAYSNMNMTHKQLRCFTKGGNAAFLYHKPRRIGKHWVKVTYSNFTKGCTAYHGGGVLVASYSKKSKVNLNVIMHKLIISNNVASTGAGMALILHGQQANIKISDSIVNDGWGVTNLHANGTNNSLPEYRTSSAGLFIRLETKTKMILRRMIIADNTAKGGVGQLALYCREGNITSFLIRDSVITHQNFHNVNLHRAAVSLQIKKCYVRKILIHNLTMSLQNRYMYGFMISRSVKSMGTVNFFNCLFTKNSIKLAVLKIFGSAPQLVGVKISNSTFEHNTGHHGSAIALSGQSNFVLANVLLTNNNMRAISLVNAYLIFTGRNVIRKNKSIRGAGVYMESDSVIYFAYGSTVIFEGNTATKVGGAFFIQSSLQSRTSFQCSLAYTHAYSNGPHSKPRLVFTNNTALQGGANLYGGVLMDCSIFLEDSKHKTVVVEVFRIGKPNETSYYFKIPLKRHIHFQFNSPNKLTSMSSDPIMVCFCDKYLFPDCSNRSRPHVTIYPGEKVVITIATVGYYGGTSFGVVLISTQNMTLVSPQSSLVTTTKCSKLSLALQSKTMPTSGKVDISVSGGLANWGLSLSVEINKCPQGFESDHGECKCAPLLQNYNITCNVTSGFHRSGNNWFAYLNNSHCLTAFDNCPFDYCNNSFISFDLQYPDRQCTSSRTGILCGQCKHGLSLLLGSNQCSKCSNVYLLLVLGFFLAGIVLVAALMFLNLTVSVGTVNGLLFYAHMVKLNEAFFFINGRIPVLSQFISWLNLDLGIEVCFFDGLDGYWMTWLQFVFPGYLFLLMGLIIIGCHYSLLLSRLCGSHAVPALATLFLMSYTKLLIAIKNALNMSHLICDDGSILQVWTIDGNIPYLSKKHLPLFIFSLFILLLGLAYPMLVLCAPLLEKYGDKCLPIRWKHALLKPLFDAYGGPYKDKYRFWTGLTLLLRLIVTVLFVFTSGDREYLNCYIIIAVTVGILTAWLLMEGVYKTRYLNWLDTAFLLNLLLLANASSAAHSLRSTYYQGIVAAVSISFSIVLFLILVGFHIRWITRGRISKNFRCGALHRITSSCDQEQLIPGSPPSRVYGTRRGVRQLDLVFNQHPSADTDDPHSDQWSPVLREREPLLFHS